jgi:hypothetical protein
MKLLSLKKILYSALMLIGLASIAGSNAKIYGNSIERVKAYEQLENILFTCIFDQSNKQPLSYFVYQVTNLVNQHQVEIGQCIPLQILECLVQDLHKVLQINRSSTPPEKNALKIAIIFKKYQNYLPPKLKQRSKQQFLAGLRFRLMQPETR